MTIAMEIENANKQLQSKHLVFVSGKVVREWLIHFGAKPEDLEALETGKVHSLMEKDYAPPMHFRQAEIQRNILIEDGLSENGKTKRIVKDSSYRSLQRFFDDEISSTDTDGADIAVKRWGDRQFWPIPPVNYVTGTLPVAISRMMENFIPDEFDKQLDITNKDSKVIINDQLLIRITKKTDGIECPSPEGVHQDGTQIVAVTVCGFSNIESFGESRFWPASTPKGCYTDEQFENKDSPYYKENCLMKHVLHDPWDTVFLNDRRVKHESRPFDGKRPAYRDVMVNQLRKPLSDGADKMVDEDGNVVSIE